MQKFAHDQAATLLDRLVYQINHAAKTGDPEAIHDLRISIRRFTQCLRAFDGFYHRRAAKKIRKRLSGILDIAAEIRNRDIALELIGKSKIPVGKPFLARIAQERKQANRVLLAEIKRWSRRNFSKKWRQRLELE